MVWACRGQRDTARRCRNRCRARSAPRRSGHARTQRTCHARLSRRSRSRGAGRGRVSSAPPGRLGRSCSGRRPGPSRSPVGCTVPSSGTRAPARASRRAFDTGQTSTPVPWDRNWPRRIGGRRRPGHHTRLATYARLQRRHDRRRRSVRRVWPGHRKRRFVRATGTLHSEDIASSDQRDRTRLYRHPDRTSGHPPRSPWLSHYPRMAFPRERRPAERRSPTRNCCHIRGQADTSHRRYPRTAYSRPRARSHFEKCILCRLDRNWKWQHMSAHRCHSRDHKLCCIRTRHVIGTPCQAGTGRLPIHRTLVRLRFRRTSFLPNLPFASPHRSQRVRKGSGRSGARARRDQHAKEGLSDDVAPPRRQPHGRSNCSAAARVIHRSALTLAPMRAQDRRRGGLQGGASPGCYARNAEEGAPSPPPIRQMGRPTRTARDAARHRNAEQARRRTRVDGSRKRTFLIFSANEIAAILRNLPESAQGGRAPAPFPVGARFIVAWETDLRPRMTDQLRAPDDCRGAARLSILSTRSTKTGRTTSSASSRPARSTGKRLVISKQCEDGDLNPDGC